MFYDELEINYDNINYLKINNLVYFQSKIWKIYEIDDSMLYLSNPSSNNIGVPISEINTILITPEIMELCGFDINSVEDDLTYFIGKDIIQTKITYNLFNDEFGVDIKLTVVNDYDFINDEYFINSLYNEDGELIWLHQIQNLFKEIYNFELIDIE